jgi:hypothetical protein
MGHIHAGISNKLKIALSNLPQLFLPGLDGYRVNKGLDLIGISIDKKIRRRDNRHQIPPASENLGKYADEIPRLLGG